MSEILIIQISKDELCQILEKSVRQVLNEITTTRDKKDDPLVKIDEICNLLQVSRVTIHKWKKDGRIPFYRLSNRIFFKKSDVLQSLQTPGFGGRYSANRKPTRPK